MSHDKQQIMQTQLEEQLQILHSHHKQQQVNCNFNCCVVQSCLCLHGSPNLNSGYIVQHVLHKKLGTIVTVTAWSTSAWP